MSDPRTYGKDRVEFVLKHYVDESPEVIIGVPCYGAKDSTLDALNSIFETSNQKTLVLVSLEKYAPPEIALLLASILSRIERQEMTCSVEVLRHEKHLGLVKHWNTLIEMSLLIPSALYFAWGSDHDHWSREWLDTCLGLLTNSPNAYLAVPNISVWSEGENRTLKRKKPPKKSYRIRTNLGAFGPGNSVYGLYRLSFFRLGFRLPNVLLPDRLLLTIIAIIGPIANSDPSHPAMWRRTLVKNHSYILNKQRETVIRGQVSRVVSYLSWPFVHLIYLLLRIRILSSLSGIHPIRLVFDIFQFERESLVKHHRKRGQRSKVS